MKNLVDVFNEGIQECHIVEIIQNDPLAGMPKSYVLDMEIFCIEMEKSLLKAILLQKDKIYQNIKKYRDLIGYYNNYLSRKMNPAGTDYYSVGSCFLSDEMHQEISQIKVCLDECYQVINHGCSILYVE